MSNSRDTVAYFLQRLGNTHRISSRYESGETKVLVDGKEVATIADDLLYVPACPESSSLESVCETDVPYLGAKAHYVISEDQIGQIHNLAKILFAIARSGC